MEILFNDLVTETVYQPTEDDIPIDIKTIAYSRMSCILWMVVKSLQNRIITLENLINNNG